MIIEQKDIEDILQQMKELYFDFFNCLSLFCEKFPNEIMHKENETEIRYRIYIDNKRLSQILTPMQKANFFIDVSELGQKNIVAHLSFKKHRDSETFFLQAPLFYIDFIFDEGGLPTSLYIDFFKPLFKDFIEGEKEKEIACLWEEPNWDEIKLS